MNLLCRLIFGLGIVAALSGCGRQQAQSKIAPAPAVAEADRAEFKKIRGPAVAGIFYPKHESDLTKQIEEYLGEVKAEPIKNLRALVCPHAGYEFSGKTAAFAYKQLMGKKFGTVILLGPSHRSMFTGAAVTDADAYETPLGLVPISPKTAEIGKIKPFAVNPPCRVERPDFWRLSPKDLPAFGEDQFDAWEHSLEVQLPFLQYTLKKFELVPVMFGEVEPADVARELRKIIDSDTLLVVSSDLSHFYPYEMAKQLDAGCVRSICNLDIDEMAREEACGKAPILALLEIARQKGWKAKLLDLRNSGDTSGNKSSVVGYAAIAFYEADAKEQSAAEKGGQTARHEFTPDQREFLLSLARKTITAATGGGEAPQVDAASLDEKFRSPRACFVTLTKNKELRGCIGSIAPEEPLCEAVVSRARAAALEDPRFPRVTSDELKDIEIEISVLTIPRRIEFKSPEDLLQKLRPNVDGVVLRVGPRQATYLPQVWEQLPDKEDFLNHLAEKAGLSASAWRGEGVVVFAYQVEAFKESEMK
jgi:AmmeMemoRadiSam system protein A